jgi:hypothetical protein
MKCIGKYRKLPRKQTKNEGKRRQVSTESEEKDNIITGNTEVQGIL